MKPKITYKILDSINYEYLEKYLSDTGRPTGKNQKFLCIKHDDHNASMKYVTDFTGKNNHKAFCDSCHAIANIFDFVEYDENLHTKEEQLKFICDKYNINNFDETIKNQIEVDSEEDENGEVKLQEELYFFNMSEKLDESTNNKTFYNQYAIKHFCERGLSIETIKKYKMTYTYRFNELLDSDANEKNKNLANYLMGSYILPFIDSSGKYTYIQVEPMARGTTKNGQKIPKYSKLAGTINILFNERYLQTKDSETIFICEGIYDALSIEEIGYKAIAMLTTTQKRFYKLLERLQPKNKKFILLLDNDLAGKKAEKEIEDYLIKNNYMVVSHQHNICDFKEKWKDPNEFLILDREEFKKYLQKLDRTGTIMNQSETQKCNSLQNIEKLFDKQREVKLISTGFKKLDNALCGGILPQTILVIGAPSGMGKTTFCINLAFNQLKERPVIYYTLENSVDNIFAKFVSHILYKTNKITKNSVDIIMNNYETDYQREEFKKILLKTDELKDLYIYNPTDPTYQALETNIEKLKNEIISDGKPAPIIIIDYLQFLQSANSYDDEMKIVKSAQRILKNYAISNDSYVCLIVANNRDSNKEKQSKLASGRGTSDIEYTCDYNLQLNYSQWEHAKRKHEDEKEEEDLKSMTPQLLSITIQKQRFGKAKEIIDFAYYGESNSYIEK